MTKSIEVEALADCTSLDAWLANFVADALAPVAVEQFVLRADQRILARVPELGEDAVLVEDLHTSTRAHWLAILPAMIQRERNFAFPYEAAELVRAAARQGHDLSTLLRAYQVAIRVLWEFVTEVVDKLPPGGPRRDDVIVRLWSCAAGWVDESIDCVIEVYTQERRWNREARDVDKSAIVDRILSGNDLDECERQQLRHPLEHWQTAYVVWSPTADGRTADVLANAAVTVAAQWGAGRPLVVPRSDRHLWCWASSVEPPTRAGVRECDLETEVHVASGSPQRGVHGFRSSHEEACAAQALASAAPLAPRLVRYSDVESLCLTDIESDAFVRMVTRELGELAGNAHGSARARETLLSYLTHGLNTQATAEVQCVHPNTVRYRLNRAEELLGRGVHEGSGQLQLALMYLSFFGNL